VRKAHGRRRCGRQDRAEQDRVSRARIKFLAGIIKWSMPIFRHPDYRHFDPQWQGVQH
jgi:hypothetical protein